MSWWTALFGEPTDWRMVKVHNVPYHSVLRSGHPNYSYSDPDKNYTDHDYSYYLYENQHKERKFDVIDSQRGDIDIEKEPKDSFVYRNTDFRTVLRPWLDGAYDPKIPSYESIKAKEMKDQLAGRVT